MASPHRRSRRGSDHPAGTPKPSKRLGAVQVPEHASSGRVRGLGSFAAKRKGGKVNEMTQPYTIHNDPKTAAWTIVVNGQKYGPYDGSENEAIQSAREEGAPI